MDGSWSNFFPYFAGAFKLIVLGIGGYFAIKWHFDEDRRVREAKGEVFDKTSFKKHLAKVTVIVILVIVAIVAVIYATDWFLNSISAF